MSYQADQVITRSVLATAATYFVGPQSEKRAAALAELVERFARESLAIILTELKPDTDRREQEFGQVVARDQRVSDAMITAMAKNMMASIEIAARGKRADGIPAVMQSA